MASVDPQVASPAYALRWAQWVDKRRRPIVLIAAALAFMFLYHLTQVLPGFIGGIFILVFEGETMFGKRKTRDTILISQMEPQGP